MIEKQFVAEKAKIKHILSRHQGFKGIGWGYKMVNGKSTGMPSVQVLVQTKHRRGDIGVDDLMPEFIEFGGGLRIPIDVIAIGKPTLSAYFGTYRPAKPGVVLSHYAAEYPGTFGALVTDNTDNKKVIVSASHVLANFNNASIGDNILQPDPTHGGTNPGSAIGTLKRFIPLNMNMGDTNEVDAAICKPTNTTIASATPMDARIKPTKQGAVGLLYAGSDQITVINPIAKVASLLNITFPKTANATVGLAIHKVGAATEYTATTISSIHVDIPVTMPNGNDVTFLDQIITAGGVSDAMAGDSGAIWYTVANV